MIRRRQYGITVWSAHSGMKGTLGAVQRDRPRLSEWPLVTMLRPERSLPLL